MSVPRRLKFAVAALVALAASAFFATPALADTQPDPELANIPYLAWRGEEVRLVKCEPDVFSGLTAGQQAGQQQVIRQAGAQFLFNFVDFLLVDWSGDPLEVRPQLEPGTVSMFFRGDGVPCVAGTFVSQKAGLAQIKLVVTFNVSLGSGAPNGPETITVKHDFNVAWMNIASSTLALTRGTTTDVAGDAGNDLQVLVTGQIPLLSNYAELGLGNQLIMPDDWARLANAIATFRDPLALTPAQFWDIHDEFSPTSSPTNPPDQHGGQSSCVHNTTAFFDTVDNCVPTLPPGIFTAAPVFTPYEIGAFSRVHQGFTNPTVGPFDPQRPFETLLSNGILDKGDAPMPSALINFGIARNTGAATDFSGVGSFCVVGDGIPTPPGQCRAVDKHIIYSRDGLGSVPPSAAAPHNLYGPFYATWIPATGPMLFGPTLGPQAVPNASGVNGPLNIQRVDCGRGNNFPGFQAGADCFYHYWDIAQVLQCGPGGTLDPADPIFGENGFCLNNFVQTGCLPLVAGGTPPTFGGASIPGLAQNVQVYTDEHGEARVRFVPGTQFFFTHLPGVAINANGGGGLAHIPGGVLGGGLITAQAKYPFEPVTARPVNSNVIAKTVTSRFEKSITCFPKGTQPEEQNAAICVARALDITGAPFVGETVCFFEDFNANPTTVDVSALFVEEGILRHILVRFPITATVGPATGVASVGGASSAPTGTTGTSGTTGTTGTSGNSGTNA